MIYTNVVFDINNLYQRQRLYIFYYFQIILAALTIFHLFCLKIFFLCSTIHRTRGDGFSLFMCNCNFLYNIKVSYLISLYIICRNRIRDYFCFLFLTKVHETYRDILFNCRLKSFGKFINLILPTVHLIDCVCITYVWCFIKHGRGSTWEHCSIVHGSCLSHEILYV